MKILIDAFGGDNSPEEVIKGTVDAVNEKKGFTAVLVGKEKKVNDILSLYKYDKERICVLDAEDVITCEEEPTLAIRKKPNSSLCVAFKELKENPEAVALVSAGSTGAVLVGATLKLGRIKGVSRPCLCPVLPSIVDGKKVFMLDVGANADCKPINLCQFAVMGSVFAKISGEEAPKVALLSNGTEDEKGNALNHETFPILKGMDNINFAGNAEARDILSGKYDVIVTDGFSGNVALKSLEGAVGSVFKLLKQEISASFKAKLGGFLLKDAFGVLKSKMDYNNGGALFLGVEKIVLKAHGSSKAITIKSTILQAFDYAERGLIDKLKKEISSVDLTAGTV